MIRVHSIDGTTHDPERGVHACARVDVTADPKSLEWQISRARKMLEADPHCWVYLHNVGRPRNGLYSFCDSLEAVADFEGLDEDLGIPEWASVARLAPDFNRPTLLNVEDGPTAFRVRPHHRAELKRLMRKRPWACRIWIIDALWEPRHPRFRAAMIAWTCIVLEKVRAMLITTFGGKVCNYDAARYAPGPSLGGWPIVGHGAGLPDCGIDGPEMYVRLGARWADNDPAARLAACMGRERCPWVAPRALIDDGSSRRLTLAEAAGIGQELARQSVADVALWRPSNAADEETLWAGRIYAAGGKVGT